jgi:hypothetical protein
MTAQREKWGENKILGTGTNALTQFMNSYAIGTKKGSASDPDSIESADPDSAKYLDPESVNKDTKPWRKDFRK